MTASYRLADYLRMKPGTIIPGMTRPENSWCLSPDWTMPENMADWKTIKISPILEHRVRWRQHLRKHSRMVGSTRVYRPPVELIRSNQDRVVVTRVDVGLPVGIYLGHIIRFDGVSLVNVLTHEGFDVWIS